MTTSSSLITCAICLDTFSYPTRLECNHIFCQSCWDDARKCSSTCPLCRNVETGPGTPDSAMLKLVLCIPIQRSCGASISKLNYQAHEKTCASCALSTKHELVSMVKQLVRRVMVVNTTLKKVQRSEKRAREESHRLRDENMQCRKRLRDREMREARLFLRNGKK